MVESSNDRKLPWWVVVSKVTGRTVGRPKFYSAHKDRNGAEQCQIERTAAEDGTNGLREVRARDRVDKRTGRRLLKDDIERFVYEVVSREHGQKLVEGRA